MSSHILQTFPIGPQWPTLDPFLFTAHHLDLYPEGDHRLAPDPQLLFGRQMGADFSGQDGWSMYHGETVPGFPKHPHRGFETVTYVRRGFCDHTDSMGAAARFGQGDTQWVTTGSGVQHAEMFPMLNRDGSNTLELFQIWLNLPAEDKMVPAYFTMLWSEDTPRHSFEGEDGGRGELTVIAGAFGDLTPQTPPPNSWAARAEADVAIWHLHLDDGVAFELPAAPAGVNRALYVFDGGAIDVDGTEVASEHGVVLEPTAAVRLTGAAGGVDVMMLQGRPIGEPVAQYGPFVMNTKSEIMQAFEDYQRTEFGGWPWPDPDPTHGDREQGRFAQHADGRLEGSPPADLEARVG